MQNKGCFLQLSEPLVELKVGPVKQSLDKGQRWRLPFLNENAINTLGCVACHDIEPWESAAGYKPTGAFDSWPLVILVDDAKQATESTMSFLWTTFTRFEPAADVKSKDRSIVRNHLAYTPPILIDARKKPWYPDELVCDPDTAKLVDRRWAEYFSLSR